MSTTENLIRAVELAAELIPGATVEHRPAVEHPTIRLPIRGVSIQFRARARGTVATMALRIGGRDRAWCNVPTVARDVEAGARRIAREVPGLIRDAVAKAPQRRERDEARRVGPLVSVRVSPEELADVTAAAKARGMTLSSLVRRGMALAAAEDPSASCDDEAHLRSVLRLLASAAGQRADAHKARIERGSSEDLVRVGRAILRGKDGAPLAPAARLFGVGWLFGDAQS